ncbi:MAG: beta-ketoacyl-[acyl-carrier-protein] synthase family protein [Planctomycetia bacterium]|nr:beta-ketoacyl-[acyl-carrier-protein] synthase family protein [Planctomycetia bacterium]
MSAASSRRVVITGMGVVCPLGLTPEDLWAGLVEGRSGVGPLESFPCGGLPLHHAAEARAFTGDIDNFGPLAAETKKAIRKGLKVMCRESQMAVAAAQRALHHSGLFAADAAAAGVQPERFGCVFGSDYMLTLPEDFTASVAKCRGADGRFAFDRWAADGMPQLTPLWLLKYLPNMPASHIAIYNDLRGPSNSLTLREASGHLALGEATITIQRGAADVMVVGATGTRVHPMKTVHALQSEQVALPDGGPPGGRDDDPAGWSRPFDRGRKGMVLGEGAAVFIVEEFEHARRRGATIHGEILGHAARNAGAAGGVGLTRQALSLALQNLPEPAAALAQQVLRDNPGLLEARQALAWAQYRSGQFAEARQLLEALPYAGNPQILEQLGDVCFKSGLTSEALQYWEKAKSKGGKSPQLLKKITDKQLYE